MQVFVVRSLRSFVLTPADTSFLRIKNYSYFWTCSVQVIPMVCLWPAWWMTRTVLFAMIRFDSTRKRAIMLRVVNVSYYECQILSPCFLVCTKTCIFEKDLLNINIQIEQNWYGTTNDRTCRNNPSLLYKERHSRFLEYRCAYNGTHTSY